MQGWSQKKKIWQVRVDAWLSSGLSQSEFCRQNHLKNSQFGYWKKALRGTQESSVFVPISLPAITPDIAKKENNDQGLTVRLSNGIGIELSGSFNSELLAQAVVALGGQI